MTTCNIDKEEIALTIENLLRSSENFDRLILEAVDAGIESGRSIGVIESYNILVREGYGSAAELLMQLISEEDQTKKQPMES
jgi:hypothetical protein